MGEIPGTSVQENYRLVQKPGQVGEDKEVEGEEAKEVSILGEDPSEATTLVQEEDKKNPSTQEELEVELDVREKAKEAHTSLEEPKYISTQEELKQEMEAVWNWMVPALMEFLGRRGSWKGRKRQRRKTRMVRQLL